MLVMGYFFEFSTEALIKAVKSGCGAKGRARSSGWNCVPSIKGCSDFGSSAISISTPLGDLPENNEPCFFETLYIFGIYFVSDGGGVLNF
jgi:hypothetical protein